MCMNIPQFSACDSSLDHEQLLHYTSIDVLKIMLKDRTLKCSSLKNVNDLLEWQRKGIENVTKATYIASFCHNKYEITYFWFQYGRSASDNRKVLLRFNNFAKYFDNAIENDWARTENGKFIFFDPKKLLRFNAGGLCFGSINSPDVECRQTIKTVKLFDVDYLLPDDEAFRKNYETQGSVSFGEGQNLLPAAIRDARSIGKHKTIQWEAEAETRIQCMMSPVDDFYFDYMLLRLKDEVFRDLVIVANPWASDKFIIDINTALSESTLPNSIKETIMVQRSELDGQIAEREQ